MAAHTAAAAAVAVAVAAAVAGMMVVHTWPEVVLQGENLAQTAVQVHLTAMRGASQATPLVTADAAAAAAAVAG